MVGRNASGIGSGTGLQNGERGTGNGGLPGLASLVGLQTERWTSPTPTPTLLENPPNFKINERHLDGRWQR